MRFSIITCTYNSEAYIRENINSVKNQTFRDFEHIFIDGFSTDNTREIIREYQREFPNQVRYFQYEPQGIAHAMNQGIRHATGEYINHLHSDDGFFDTEVLEKIDNFIQKNNLPDIVYGKASFRNPETGEGRVIPHRKIYQKIRFWLLLLTNYIPHQATFIKKRVFETQGVFAENYRNSMDYELWLRLSQRKIPSSFINTIVCNFSVRNDSQSSQYKDLCLSENIAIFKKYVHNETLLKVLELIARVNFLR